jgi:branched-chain amino acid transport system permease protein
MLQRLNTLDARLRNGIYGAGALVALLLVTQFAMPGSEGGGRGTPAAILFQGLVLGVTYAVFATGVILVYRAIRIVNFAQGALGSLGAVFMLLLVQYTPVPFVVAVVLGLLVSTLAGVIFGVFMLKFLTASRLFLTVATVVLTGLITGLGIAAVVQAPFFPPLNERTSADVLTPELVKQLLPFAGLDIQIGALPLKYGFPHLFALELCIVAIVAVALFLRYTRLGTAMRALAENPERASLLGISVGSVSILVWVLAAFLDGVAVTSSVLAAGSVGNGLEALLPIFAVAVLARFANYGQAWFIALLLGIFTEAFFFSFDSDEGLLAALLFFIVSAGLIIQRRRLNAGRSESAEVSWAATAETRAIPRELASVTGIRIAKYSIYAVCVGVVILFPFVLSVSQTELLSVVFINAIAVLSLVVLTGWAGQVSLGQYAFVAIGAVIGGALSTRLGVPFWFAVPLAAALTGAIAVLVGIPALRVKGLFLLVSTFAFALAVQALLFDERYFGWLLPGAIDRPTLFFLDFDEDRSMYFLCAAALVANVVVVTNLRRSRVGRVLIALRDNENSVAAFGITVLRATLTAFAIAGSMAGFAGAILSHQQRGVSADAFGAQANADVFIQAIIGGVSSPLGALLGSAYFVLTNQFLGSNPIVAAFVTGLGPVLIIFFLQGGLVSLVNKARDAVLRIVAQRRGIIVPSLFADYDPEALERQLIPLAEPDALSGLAALPTDERFALASELYAGTGVRIIDKLGPVRETVDAAAIGAAARAALEAIENEELDEFDEFDEFDTPELAPVTSGADR